MMSTHNRSFIFHNSAPDSETSASSTIYWILDVSTSSSSVDIDDNRTVDDLRKKIVNENPVGLAQVDAAGLSLWKVSVLPTSTNSSSHPGKVSIPVTRKLNELVSN